MNIDDQCIMPIFPGSEILPYQAFYVSGEEAHGAFKFLPTKDTALKALFLLSFMSEASEARLTK